MKKILMLLGLCLVSITMIGCKDSKLTKIKVAEVARSVFYASQYVALSKGYFEEEGLKIDLVNANGADKVTAALLSGDVQIGLQGPEPTIYLYKNNRTNYLINFAQLTRTDGSFIFGREKIENFTLDDLRGKSILGGRKGGVPEMTLEYVLKQAGLEVGQDDDTKDVNVRTDVAFAALTGSFLDGEGDFVSLFEPTATALINQNRAYLLAATAEYAGEITYTAYSTSIKYFNNNKEVLEKFTKALYRGQQFVQNATDEEIAKEIQPFFTDVELDVLISVVARYRSINAWCTNPIFSEVGFDRLQDIIITAGELDSKVNFSDLVDLTIAKKVVEEK